MDVIGALQESTTYVRPAAIGNVEVRDVQVWSQRPRVAEHTDKSDQLRSWSRTEKSDPKLIARRESRLVDCLAQHFLGLVDVSGTYARR